MPADILGKGHTGKPDPAEKSADAALILAHPSEGTGEW
jgi:hypothetical protein